MRPSAMLHMVPYRNSLRKLSFAQLLARGVSITGVELAPGEFRGSEDATAGRKLFGSLPEFQDLDADKLRL